MAAPGAGGGGPGASRAEAAPRWAWTRRTAIAALAGTMALGFVLTVSASRRMSTTFDEIVMIAGGARGFETGRFDLALEHPPLTQYLYGSLPYLSGLTYPEEPDVPMDVGYRYRYARALLIAPGNDVERIAWLGRLPAALCGALLVLLVYLFAAGPLGRGAAVLAAVLVAFLPDVLAHGGVAYNDLPLAAAFLGALWAIDHAARRPSAPAGAVAGAAVALALAIKFSAIALLPIAGAIVLAEGAAHTGLRTAWLRDLGLATLTGACALWAVLVLAYGGDPGLTWFRFGLDFTFRHVGGGHSAAAYLLGARSPEGWWYFFPVAFLFKTPAALHLLALLAALVVVSKRTRVAAGPAPRPWRARLASPLRACVIAILVFGGALLTSSLNIGFRYALPLLPLICVLIAAMVAAAWRSAGGALRLALAVLVVASTASVAARYPNYLAYISEYGPGGGRGDRVLLDSNLDWGQGLLELRRFMRERGIARVYLSYFGSAEPAVYGIEYVALPSFFPLQGGTPDTTPRPRWMAVSATNLHGIYLLTDPFASLRAVEPDAILAGSLFLYDVGDQGTAADGPGTR